MLTNAELHTQHDAHKARITRMGSNRPLQPCEVRQAIPLSELPSHLREAVPTFPVAQAGVLDPRSPESRQSKAEWSLDVLAILEAEVASRLSAPDAIAFSATQVIRERAIVMILANLQFKIGLAFLSARYGVKFEVIVEDLRRVSAFLQSVMIPTTADRPLLISQIDAYLRDNVAVAHGKEPALNSIIAVVAEFFGYTVIEFTGRRQCVQLYTARDVAVWCMRTFTKASTPMIGRALNRDHSTVVVASQRMNKRMQELGLRPLDHADDLFQAIRFFIANLPELKDSLPNRQPLAIAMEKAA